MEQVNLYISLCEILNHDQIKIHRENVLYYDNDLSTHFIYAYYEYFAIHEYSRCEAYQFVLQFLNRNKRVL